MRGVDVSGENVSKIVGLIMQYADAYLVDPYYFNLI